MPATNTLPAEVEEACHRLISGQSNPAEVLTYLLAHKHKGVQKSRWGGGKSAAVKPLAAPGDGQTLRGGAAPALASHPQPPAATTSRPPGTPIPSLQALDELVGLGQVKSLVRELSAYIEVQRRRQAAGLKADSLVLHMVFRGNPGTGKTTVARLMGQMFKEMGVLPKGHLVEVERADLVGGYIGHTAQKTREQIRKALGGILFIDEAYSLIRGGEKDFGRESIDALVKALEDHKNELVVILAGYRDEMDQFLRTNPGIQSRFPIKIDFPDYTLEELLQIADHMLKNRDYALMPAARQVLAERLEAYRKSLPPYIRNGNARTVRNLIEHAIRLQAVRVVAHAIHERDGLMFITPEDIRAAVWEEVP